MFKTKQIVSFFCITLFVSCYATLFSHTQAVSGVPVFQTNIEIEEDTTPTDVDTYHHSIAPATTDYFNFGEKSDGFCRIISTVRQLPTNTLFKIFWIKHIIKNQFSIREVIVNNFYSQKLCNGYYTHGLGNLRI